MVLLNIDGDNWRRLVFGMGHFCCTGHSLRVQKLGKLRYCLLTALTWKFLDRKSVKRGYDAQMSAIEESVAQNLCFVVTFPEKAVNAM